MPADLRRLDSNTIGFANRYYLSYTSAGMKPIYESEKTECLNSKKQELLTKATTDQSYPTHKGNSVTSYLGFKIEEKPRRRDGVLERQKKTCVISGTLSRRSH